MEKKKKMFQGINDPSLVVPSKINGKPILLMKNKGEYELFEIKRENIAKEEEKDFNNAFSMIVDLARKTDRPLFNAEEVFLASTNKVEKEFSVKGICHLEEIKGGKSREVEIDIWNYTNDDIDKLKVKVFCEEQKKKGS